MTPKQFVEAVRSTREDLVALSKHLFELSNEGKVTTADYYFDQAELVCDIVTNLREVKDE